jgi:hypothetical protein
MQGVAIHAGLYDDGSAPPGYTVEPMEDMALDQEKQTFERRPPLARVDATLAAETYNLSRILLAANSKGCVFVPIRAMQYLAVIDTEEIIFVDSQYRRWVEIAWRDFHPGARVALDAPVAYTAVYYQADGAEVMKRLLPEFQKALRALAGKQGPRASARVLPFAPRT